MHSFLKRILLFLGFFAGILSATLVFQLYFINKLWHIIPEKEPVIARDIDDRANAKKINIVGCSNLKFDIDINEVRKNNPGVNINKYTFAGSLNSCYLKYMIRAIRASGNNDRYIVFAPTDLFFKQNTFPHNPFFYEFGISRDFLLFLFRENPMVLISENWYKVYKQTAQHHFQQYNTLFHDGRGDMDELLKEGTPFSTCTMPFDRTKHHILLPALSETDAAYFNDIFGKENYNIINSPIPNMAEHLHYDYTIFERSGFNKPLDPADSVIRDSSLFYDQWYHMNKCGRTVETAKFIRELRQLHPDN